MQVKAWPKIAPVRDRYPPRMAFGVPQPPHHPKVPGLLAAVERGPRVFLRLPTGGDRDQFLKLRDASRDWLMPWEPLNASGEPPFDDEAFDRFHKTSETELSRRFLICLLDSGTIVGQISLNNILRGALQSCAIGYWIGAAHAGRGLMTEALEAATRHAFVTLGLHRVEANIIPRNAPSIALVKKLGFRYEGTALRYLKIAGEWQDHERWAKTVED